MADLSNMLGSEADVGQEIEKYIESEQERLKQLRQYVFILQYG